MRLSVFIPDGSPILGLPIDKVFGHINLKVSEESILTGWHVVIDAEKEKIQAYLNTLDHAWLDLEGNGQFTKVIPKI